MDLDKKIFKDKSVSNLFEEIYTNSKDTKKQVHNLILDLQPLVENVGDATLVVPLIKEYLDIKVKNDEHLIKLATVIQRSEASAAKGESMDFDLSDLEELVKEQEEITQEVKKKSKES